MDGPASTARYKSGAREQVLEEWFGGEDAGCPVGLGPKCLLKGRSVVGVVRVVHPLVLLVCAKRHCSPACNCKCDGWNVNKEKQSELLQPRAIAIHPPPSTLVADSIALSCIICRCLLPPFLLLLRLPLLLAEPPVVSVL